MPTYDYVCRACSHAFEHFQSMQDATLRKCPKCGRSKLERLIGSGAGILFKGTGFYETDYKTKSGGPKSSDGPGKSGGDSGEKGGAKAETKAETKADAKGDGKGDTKADPKSGAKEGGQDGARDGASKAPSKGKKES